MMMDHHRFAKPSNTSNVMIGGNSDPASGDDFDYTNTIDNSTGEAQSSAAFGDDAFDKINMDFDSIMANNDLDVSNNMSSSYAVGGKGAIRTSDGSVNSDVLLEKLNAELGGTSELKGMGHSPGEFAKGKIGDIGDELDMELLDAVLTANEENGSQSASASGGRSDSSIDQLLKTFPNAEDGNGQHSDDASIDKLLNIPIIDMDNHNDSRKNAPNIDKGDGTDSLCDSMASLPSIGHISPNASFANMNNGQMQQQQAMLMQQQQQQQQLLLQQQMLQQQQNNSGNNSSIQSIVNDQLSQLPQANELNRIGMAGLEHEKMKLIKRLQEIEGAGTPMNDGQRQQNHQQQQQFLMQKQMLLQQQQLQQQQQQLQQQGITAASSMPSLGSGGHMLQGQIQLQGQQAQNFVFNQQMVQQQQGGMAQGVMAPTPIAMNNNMNSSNNNNAMQSSMFSNANTNNSNDNNNSKKKSIFGLKGSKDTPLFSFLRNRKRPGDINSSNMMMTGKQQQELAVKSTVSPIHSALAGTSAFGNNSKSGVLDAAPIDFSNSSSNPFLRREMMNNLDQSVGRMNSARGRLSGLPGNRGLSSAMRRNMMQQMSTTGQLSKSCKELRRNTSSDSYESAGIIARVNSADHIPTRRASLSAGAAKAQNRRFTLSRSNNSFGNLTKTKGGSRRDLNKSGGGSSTRSLGGLGGSTRSLCSNDSQSSLIPIKRRGSLSGGIHGAKHKLGGAGGSARRTSSVPYMGAAFGDTAASFQQRNQDNGPQHNHGWP